MREAGVSPWLLALQKQQQFKVGWQAQVLLHLQKEGALQTIQQQLSRKQQQFKEGCQAQILPQLQKEGALQIMQQQLSRKQQQFKEGT